MAIFLPVQSAFHYNLDCHLTISERIKQMRLSYYTLEKMGFQTLPEGEFIAGTFCSLHVYEIQGFTVDSEMFEPHSGQIKDTPFKFCVGSSVNKICKKLVGDDFVEDEEDWQKRHKCKSPYLMIYLGPTKEHRGTGVHFKRHQDTIETYDGFPEAKKELKTQEDAVLPPLLSALTCSFAFSDFHIRLLPAESTCYGKTSDGKTIHDFRIVGSMTGYTSKRIEAKELHVHLTDAVILAGKINSKVAQFYHLALNEHDSLKRFLYFFLAIEIQTHAAFATIDHADKLSRLIVPPERVTTSTKKLFSEQRDNWKALKDRFVWCALWIWTDLSDADIEDFDKIRAIRDNIAHGRTSIPTAASVAAVEKLATKLQFESK